jgi:hypothetical protein
MKKLSIFLPLFLLLILAGNSFAEGLLPTARAGSEAAKRQALITQNDANKIQDLKKRADSEITRRINSLTELMSKINTLKKLSVTDKSSLVTKLQAEINNLNILKTKIDADTDLVMLKTDVSSIVQSYRVYLVFLPQTRILITADSMGTTADNLTTLSNKLQTLITGSGETGATLTNLQNLLTDMQAKIKDAQTQYQAADTEVLPLTPQGYPGNITSLKDARLKLKTGTTDLKIARDDAKQLVKVLRSLKKTLKATGSATLNK